ncbi:MAG: hypothetical protein Q8Q02_03995 [Nocardioides sp.]|nr:hypothetical protein [Nocardioides sp.]
MNPEALFDQLVELFTREDDVDPPGESPGPWDGLALSTAGRVFAVLVSDQLVVRLTEERVEALVAAGGALPFTDADQTVPGWAALPLEQNATWEEHAREALELARG